MSCPPLEEKWGQEIKVARGKPHCVFLQWLHIFLMTRESVPSSNLFPILWIRHFVMQGGSITCCC